jgi:hypothetical protein
MSGGGGFKKKIIGSVLAHPCEWWIGSGVALWSLRWYQTQSTYGYWFGKFDYDRRRERGELH